MPGPERSDADEPELAKTVTLSEEDIKHAARLFRLMVRPAEPDATLPPRKDRHSLVLLAQKMLDARRSRNRHFDPDLFGEPAWEMLLALYVAEGSGARLTMSKLADRVGIPLSTAVRWLKALEERSLVARSDHPNDRRIVFIRLRERGQKALDSYLAGIAA